MKEKLKKLEQKYGNKECAAKELGISVRQFYRLINGYPPNKTLAKLINILAET